MQKISEALHLKRKRMTADYEPEIEVWESDTDDEDDAHAHELDRAVAELPEEELRMLMR